MRARPRCLMPLACSSVAAFAATAAFAAPSPLGWDVAAETGVVKRFTTGRAHDAPNPGFGVAFEVQGHVALLPMIRLGAYAVQDLSPASGIAARQFWAAGLHLKVMPPLIAAPWRAWVFAGLGYASAYEPSYLPKASSPPGGPPPVVRIRGEGGSLLEAPFGVGLGYRVRRPWELFAELGARFGITFWGAMYDGGATEAARPFLGKDSLALSFSLGLSLAE